MFQRVLEQVYAYTSRSKYVEVSRVLSRSIVKQIFPSVLWFRKQAPQEVTLHYASTWLNIPQSLSLQNLGTRRATSELVESAATTVQSISYLPHPWQVSPATVAILMAHTCTYDVTAMKCICHHPAPSPTSRPPISTPENCDKFDLHPLFITNNISIHIKIFAKRC